MAEEKSAQPQPALRRSGPSQSSVASSSSSSAGGGGGSGGAAMLAAVEARLSGSVAQASLLAAAAASANSQPEPTLPNLPSSTGSSQLRASTAALIGAGPAEAPLDWAELQFKRAGVAAATSSLAHATPVAHLGIQQRARHAQLFSVVEKLRDGQQHIFLEQFNQFPNVESHSADDYSRIWHAFKAKDDEAQHILAKLNGLCDNIDTLNKHTNNPHM